MFHSKHNTKVTRDWVISYLIAIEQFSSKLAIECADDEIMGMSYAYPIAQGTGQIIWSEKEKSFIVQHNESLPTFLIRHF